MPAQTICESLELLLQKSACWKTVHSVRSKHIIVKPACSEGDMNVTISVWCMCVLLHACISPDMSGP